MMAAEVLAVTLLLLLASSCRISYKLNGAALDYTVYKTVRIDNFPIRAALVYPPLQQTLKTNFSTMCSATRVCRPPTAIPIW